jgi:hypothetical protein
VPPVPPPPPLLPPPQAARNSRPEIIRQASDVPNSFFLLELNLVPSTAIPRIGSSIAQKRARNRVETGASDAVGPVVLIVKLEAPEALLIEDGLNLQAGGSVLAGGPLSIMLLQERLTV